MPDHENELLTKMWAIGFAAVLGIALAIAAGSAVIMCGGV